MERQINPNQTLIDMNLRSFNLGTALLLGIAVFAQPMPPYDVTVGGVVLGCSPNGSVNITTNSITQPAIDIDVTLDANCSFSIDLLMDSYSGGFILSTPCNGAIQQAAAAYQVNALQLDSTYLFVTFNCTNSAIDCLGISGGSNLPGSPCNDNDPNTLGDAWTADCMCAGGPALPCYACITISQATTPAVGDIPFMAYLENCSGGGVAPYTYAWSFDGGLTYEAAPADTAMAFTTGTHLVCMMMTSADGCTSIACDSLIVDSNGVINGGTGAYDCLQILNGPNVPGTPCTLFGANEFGTWSAACMCMPDSSNTTCEAGFFAMQAYQWVDSAANPNGGGGEPVPNELWIWNLSSGGAGNFQYTWDFGDGTTSTDPFPTHTYASGSAYLLCLTIADGAGCTDTYCDSISVDGDGLLNGLLAPGNRNTFTVNVMNALSTGVQETPAHADLSTWPNPVSNNLMLSLQSAKSGRLEVSILDLNGRVVLSTSDPISAGKNQLVVPVNELVSGVYVVRIGDGTNSVSRRFVKQ